MNVDKTSGESPGQLVNGGFKPSVTHGPRGHREPARVDAGTLKDSLIRVYRIISRIISPMDRNGALS